MVSTGRPQGHSAQALLNSHTSCSVVIWPVLEAVVSNVKLEIESAECHDVRRSPVKSAMMLPDFRSVPGWCEGTASSFSSCIFPTMTARCTCPIWRPTSRQVLSTVLLLQSVLVELAVILSLTVNATSLGHCRPIVSGGIETVVHVWTVL